MLCPEILPKTKGTLGFTHFCPAGVTSVKCFEPSLEKVSALGGDGVYMIQCQMFFNFRSDYFCWYFIHMCSLQ